VPFRPSDNGAVSPGQRSYGPLETYLWALRHHRLLVLAAVLAAIGGHLAWRAVSTPRYEATAQLLVNAISADDDRFLGLPVIRETPREPTRAIETAAALLHSPQAAERAARSLRSTSTVEHILDVVSLEPQGQSSVIAVTATASTPDRAQRLADAFARAALLERSDELQRAATTQIPEVAAQLEALGKTSSAGASELRERLNALRGLRDEGDPTLSLSQPARAPQDASGPSSTFTLLLVLLGGFVIGSIAALARTVFTRSVRDEDDAVSLYPLPVLARVPLLSRRQLRATRGPEWVPPPGTREAFRTILAQLGHRGGGGVVMVTSASSGDGKTTTAINLAAAAAESGAAVILLDFDLRKPEVGASLGLPNGTSSSRFAGPQFDLDDALVPALGLGGLSVLNTTLDDDRSWILEVAKRRLPELIEAARGKASWVIIDTAPLGLVSDALGILDEVDHVIITARPGATDRKNLETLRELLTRTRDRPPTGMLVITKPSARSPGYYGGMPLASHGRRTAAISPEPAIGHHQTTAVEPAAGSLASHD